MSNRCARLGLAACALAVFLAGCASAPRSAGERGAEAVVRNYHAALNRGDLLPLTLYVTPDVEWYTVVDDQRILEVSGREALSEALRAYLARDQEASWGFDVALSHGAFVAVRERSRWRGADGRGERVSLCVYEIHDGRIRRITQYLSAD